MAKHRFTFEPETKGAETKNAVYALYLLYKKSAVKNPKFKVQFVSTIVRTKNNFGASARALLEIYKQTKELKCVCCNSKEAHFRFVKNNNTIMLQPFVDTAGGEKMLTVDHDTLAALDGTNTTVNLNPLCSTCNELRGSRFAGYAEFKHWYDNTPPNHRTVMPAPNFCFIDFKRNLLDGHHAKSITGATCLPPSTANEIIKEFRRGGNSPFETILYSKWALMNRVFVNEFFNTLVYERIRHGHGIRTYERENVDFFTFPKGVTDHRNQRNRVQAKIDKMISTARKEHRIVVNAINAESTKEKEVVHVPESFIAKLLAFARKLIA